MRKVSWWTAVVLVVSFGFISASADEPSPANRVVGWAPQAPGTRSTVRLQYGPYTVGPGSDLSRPEADVLPADAFIIEEQVSALGVDGKELPGNIIHAHHAGWTLVTGVGQNKDIMKTGEEETRLDYERVARADPRYASGLRYGIEVHTGDKLRVNSMLHNKSSQPVVAYVELRLEVVHGTREAIKQAVGLDFHPLEPYITNIRTFTVPRTGSLYTWPRDLPAGAGLDTGGAVPGVGNVWTVPQDGTMLLGATHLHPGGREVVFSNLGSADDPCSDEGDGFAGTTIARLRAFTRGGVFPSEDQQLAVTKDGWRAEVRAGDRIAINGIYDAREFGFLDAMIASGLWIDPSEPPVGERTCSPRLLDQPGAYPASVIEGIPNKEWHMAAMPTCTQCDNLSVAQLPSGAHMNAAGIRIAAFLYSPGDQSTASAPWVLRGERFTVSNADFPLGSVRHTITSCSAPCNGPYVANYPNWDGVFDSGVLGGQGPLDPYLTASEVPVTQINTSNLSAGYYPYYCRLHPWMRGAFYVFE